MSAKDVLERFIDKNPLAVMTRAVAGALLGDHLDEVFEQHRSRQYKGTIKFSTVAIAMAEIALGTVKNCNQAYHRYQEELQTSKEAFYGKLNRTEPSVSEAMVSYGADQAAKLYQAIGFQPWDVLSGYRCFSMDGNHQSKTEKRLKEIRGLCAAPLPGIIVGRFDLQSGFFDRAYLLEDGHAQESTVLGRVLNDLAERDLIIADRHFCIVSFLAQMTARRACFVIRQHGRLKGKLLGKRQKIGQIDSGDVYEQELEIHDKDYTLVVRRLTLLLHEPTRDGDTELHILTNVPTEDASACELAQLYRQRWEIENAFYLLTTTLVCEMKSNCHPRCGLFLFCMAMLAYNCRQVLLAALYAEHEREEVEQMSQYQVSVDIVSPMDGMLTAIDEQEWEELVPQDAKGMAKFLRHVSQQVDMRSYRKSVRGPKKPPPERERCPQGTHISLHSVLEQRKQRC